MAIFKDVIDAVDIATTQHIAQNVSALAGWLQGPAHACLGIYILLWGFSHFMGLVKEPITDSLKRILKVTAIMTLALNTMEYNKYITDFFTKAPIEIAGIFQATPGANAETTSVSLVDDILRQLWEVGNAYWRKGDMVTILPFILALLIYGFALGISAYAGYLIILSKLATAVLLGIGPLLIISLMFESTKKFFENWIGLLCNFAFVLILVSTMTGLFGTILSSYYAIALQGANKIEISTFAPIALVCIIACMLFQQIMSIASTLGGGVALGTMGAMNWVGGKLGGAGSAAAGAGARAAGRQLQRIPRPWSSSTAKRG